MLKSINRRRLLALGISLPLAGKLMSQDTISQTGVEILDLRVISWQPDLYHGWPTLARRKEGEMEDTFVRLAQEEEALRESMRQQGRQFSACEGLTREELHDRHALR